MLPFDGSSARSILVMDNASVHHIQEVKSLLQQAGINPIEECFSYIKSYLRKHDSLLQVISNPINVIKSAFADITPVMCMNWISHAGYSHTP